MLTDVWKFSYTPKNTPYTNLVFTHISQKLNQINDISKPCAQAHFSHAAQVAHTY